MIFFKAGKFDTSRIPNTVFAEFLKEYGPTAITGGLTHDAFADRVSNIIGIQYGHRVKKENEKIIVENYESANKGVPFKKPEQDDGWYYYELNSSLPNIVLAINHLLGFKLQNFNEFITKFNLTCKQKEVQQESVVLGEAGEVPTTICKITDVDKKKCELSIQPKHAEVKEFVSLTVEEGLEKLPKQIFLEKFASQDSMLLPMLNLFGIELGHRETMFTLSEIPQGYWIMALALQDLKSSNKKLIGLIGETKIPASQSNWYAEFTSRLTKIA
jgi:hypothetical protein